jgi:conserved oligomeric Golgi complex subunit 2
LLSPCSDGVIQVVKESIVQAGQSLQQLLPAILDIMIESIVEKSVEVSKFKRSFHIHC